MKLSLSLLFLLALLLISFVEMKKINIHQPFCLAKNSIVESKVQISQAVWATFHTDDCCSKESRQAYVCYGKLTNTGPEQTWTLDTPCATSFTSKPIGLRGETRTVCN